MICGVVTSHSVENCRRDMANSSSWVDCFELRLDYMEKIELDRLIEDRLKPIIVTCRPLWEGGRFRGSEEDRIRLLREADRLGADYVDIEWKVAGQLGNLRRSRRILSMHDFECFPSDLGELEREMRGGSGDIIKIAVTARDCFDSLAMLRFLRQSHGPVIGLCMGTAASFTRILGPLWGSYLTYGTLEKLEGSAVGQYSVKDLFNNYRLHNASANTMVYGVMGVPLGHSKSPQIHNAAFDALGLDAVYVAFEVDRDPVRFIHEIKDLGVKGLSITVPHKRQSMGAMDCLDPIARKIGALNTVHVQNGQLWGYNTDWSAAVNSIEEMLPQDISLQGLESVVVGAGGVARSVVFGLLERGAHVTVANRTLDKATSLAYEAGLAAIALEELERGTWYLVANCTSVGMWPQVDSCIIPEIVIKKAGIVYDTVYNPIDTRLLKTARQSGCVTVSGSRHFLLQAAEQFELWTGRKPPLDIMANALI